MLGQCATSGSVGLDNRIFVYEVTGLSQSDLTARCQQPIRTSHNQFIQVPFHRMSEEMQRITQLGGKIVNIHTLEDALTTDATPAEVPAESSDE